MKTNKKKDVFNLVNQLQHILNQKPTEERMLKEVKLMKFKIRPVFGDISLLNFKNLQLVEALWGLGKLDEFFHQEINQIAPRDQKVFFHLMNQIRGKLENQLSKVSFKKPVDIPQAVEMEIFKEYPRKKN